MEKSLYRRIADSIARPVKADGTDEARHAVLCGGSFIAGPGTSPLLILTAALIVLPAVLLQRELPRALGGPVALLAAGSLYAMCQTALIDPGVIPRPGVHDVDAVPKTLIEIINGVEVERRWCYACQHHRPPRAKHCHVCDVCVAVFDHHCPWVTNCIGVRNRRWFVVFVTATAACLALAAAGCLSEFFVALRVERLPSRSLSDALVAAMINRSVLVALLMFTTWVFFPVAGLSLFHFYLNCRNLTTAEYLREPFASDFLMDNPYDLGVRKNLKLFWCMPLDPSRLNLDGNTPRRRPSRSQDQDLELAEFPPVVVGRAALDFAFGSEGSGRARDLQGNE